MWYEDLLIGEEAETGSHTFTAEAIVDFARLYDPQPFHLDEAAGKASLFGGLAASGWHTAAIFMKLMVAYRDRQIEEARAEGRPIPGFGPSPGFEDMRWPRPVLAGDTLTYRTRLIGLRPSISRPEWGIADHHHWADNQRGERAFEFTGHVFVRRRNAGAGAA